MPSTGNRKLLHSVTDDTDDYLERTTGRNRAVNSSTVEEPLVAPTLGPRKIKQTPRSIAARITLIVLSFLFGALSIFTVINAASTFRFFEYILPVAFWPTIVAAVLCFALNLIGVASGVTKVLPCSILAVFVAALLAAYGIGGIVVVMRLSDGELMHLAPSKWNSTVAHHKSSICDFESYFQCQGWETPCNTTATNHSAAPTVLPSPPPSESTTPAPGTSWPPTPTTGSPTSPPHSHTTTTNSPWPPHPPRTTTTHTPWHPPHAHTTTHAPFPPKHTTKHDTPAPGVTLDASVGHAEAAVHDHSRGSQHGGDVAAEEHSSGSTAGDAMDLPPVDESLVLVAPEADDVSSKEDHGSGGDDIDPLELHQADDWAHHTSDDPSDDPSSHPAESHSATSEAPSSPTTTAAPTPPPTPAPPTLPPAWQCVVCDGDTNYGEMCGAAFPAYVSSKKAAIVGCLVGFTVLALAAAAAAIISHAAVIHIRLPERYG